MAAVANTAAEQRLLDALEEIAGLLRELIEVSRKPVTTVTVGTTGRDAGTGVVASEVQALKAPPAPTNPTVKGKKRE